VRNYNGLLAITVLLIDETFQLRSAMLSTQPLLCATNHFADNIASSLRAELINWYLLPKLCAIETDNASSMIKACELLEKRHLPCHAHCLNFVDKDSLSIKSIQTILTKCKRIVTFISTIAYEKLKKAQGVDKPYSLIQAGTARSKC